MKAKRKRAAVKAEEVASQKVAAAANVDTNAMDTTATDVLEPLTGEQSNDASPRTLGNATQEVVTLNTSIATNAAETHVYVLPASCTVRDSGALKSVLLDLLMSPRAVTFDVSGVERIDTAAMQVLCAFVRDRKAAGGNVQWVGSTEGFSEAVRLLGLQHALEVPGTLITSAAA
jgi:phospholipid transport system transporter-binding protein